MASSFRSFRSIKAPSPAALSAPCRMRLSPTPISSLRVDPVPFSQRCPDEQSRFYATPRARAPRGQNPAVRAKAKTWADLQKPAVLSNDLVATYNLETIIRTAGFRHQPHQYTDCTEKFKSVADRGDHRWPFLLSEEERPSPQLIHETACLLSTLKTADPTGVTAIGLWVGASEMGHVPSTLTLRLSFRNRDSQLGHPLLKPFEARFRSLVAAGNPQALAIEGMLLADRDQPDAAIRLIERALSLDRDGSVWRTGCHGVLGETYVKVGRTTEGKKHLQMAIGQKMAQYGEPLSKLVEDKDEAWALLYEAACVRPSLFSHLADAEVLRAEQLSVKEERDEAYKMASEWSRLADPNAQY